MSSATQKCVDTFCEKALKNAKKARKTIKNEMTKALKNVKKMQKTMKNKKMTVKQQEKLETTKQNIENYFKYLKEFATEKVIKKLDKDTMQMCKDNYCNIGCKGTFVEDGTGFSKEFMKKRKHLFESPLMRKSYEKMRKEEFGNKTSVLNDSFYEKLKPNDVKKMKKQGIISACVKSEKMPKFV